MINENFEETYLFYKSLNKTRIHFWIWQIISSYIPTDFRGWEVFDSNNSGILHLSSSCTKTTELEPHSAVTGAWKGRRCRQQHDKTNDRHSRALQKHLSGYVGSYWPIDSMQQCLPESLKKRTSKYSETLSFLTSGSIGVLTKESTLALQLQSVVKPIILESIRLFFFPFMSLFIFFFFLQVLMIVKCLSVNTQLHSPTSLRPITDQPSEQFNSK